MNSKWPWGRQRGAERELKLDNERISHTIAMTSESTRLSTSA